jgi:tetrahydromethanopterin S-methyltransferase subunit G
MEAMRKSWTDERLDDFREEVSRRFDGVDRRLDELKEEMNRSFDGQTGEMNRRFGEVERRVDKADSELHRVVGRLDTLTKAVVFSSLTLSASVIAGFIAVGS